MRDLIRRKLVVPCQQAGSTYRYDAIDKQSMPFRVGARSLGITDRHVDARSVHIRDMVIRINLYADSCLLA